MSTESPAGPPSLGRPRRRFFDRRRLRRWSIAGLALGALWLLVSLIVARRLTARHRPRFEEPVPIVTWARFEPHRLRTVDGHEIGAWFADGRDDAPSVILLHGNGGDRRSNLSRAEMLAGEGSALLLISFRAHGDSTGDFNDIGYSARRDVVAAVEFLEARRPGRPIVVLGSSLGAAAATFASADLGRRVSGYILEAPYLDLKSAVRNRTSEALPVGLEWVAYRGLLAVSPLVIPELDRISPFEAIAGIPEDVPVLMISGRLDRKARLEQVERLFDRVRSHGRMVVFDRAGHLHYDESDAGLFRESILGFVRESAIQGGVGLPSLRDRRNSTADPASSKTSQ